MELDQRMRALQMEMRARAADLRRVAMELDRDPEAVRRHLDLGAVSCLATMTIPPEYNPDVLRIGRHRYYGAQCFELVVAMEELACGDAAMVLASPGPSLSGVLVRELADEQQKQRYYTLVMQRPTWTFFALTEPGSGSDAGAMQTVLVPAPAGNGLLLTGTKRYIGNGARAGLGVVFARNRPGPLGVTAVLVETDAPGFAATPLDTIGLRGALLSELTLDAVHVAPEQVLGRHLSATRRGMWGAVRTFNRVRPSVAALALGIARSAHEYVVANRGTLRADERYRLDQVGGRLAATRQLIWRAAAAADQDASTGSLASAAKARAARLAEEVTRMAPGFFGPGARLEHPILDKLARDACGMEFMEGTTNIQKLNLFQAFRQGRLDHGRLKRENDRHGS